MELYVPHGTGSDVAALHQALVEKLKRDGNIKSAQVEAAFRAVPRHVFLPGAPLDQVYRDVSVITKRLNGINISSSSQPAVMAIMLEQLGLAPGQRVLEIGAGTGYNAALIAHIVGDTGHVVTLDIDDDIVEQAREHILAAGFDTVTVVCGDGGLGYANAAPYDRIILTAGAWDLAPAWLEQLKPDGQLLVPLSIRGAQRIVAFERADDHWASTSASDCSFIRLRGAFSGPESVVQLGPDSDLGITVDDSRLVHAEAVYKLLTAPKTEWKTNLRTRSYELRDGLCLWLAAHEPGFCSLIAQGEAVKRGLVPALFRYMEKTCQTVGLLGETSLCVLTHAPDQPPPLDTCHDSLPFELLVRSVGPDDRLPQHLVEQINAWDAAGRPSSAQLRISVYLPDRADVAPVHAPTLVKQWTKWVFDWQ
jgi:protein-L-isoaspartate(D-aspartate) O-methyltransferase